MVVLAVGMHVGDDDDGGRNEEDDCDDIDDCRGPGGDTRQFCLLAIMRRRGREIPCLS